MKRLTVLALFITSLWGCSSGATAPFFTLPAPFISFLASPKSTDADSESSVISKLPEQGFIFQPTTGLHYEGDFVRLRSLSANRWDYSEIKVNYENDMVMIDIWLMQDGYNSMNITGLKLRGFLGQTEGVKGLYSFEGKQEFIYECGQSADLAKKTINNLDYQVQISSEVISDTECLIRYTDNYPNVPHRLEMTLRDGIIVALQDVNSGINYDNLDDAYNPRLLNPESIAEEELPY